MCVFIPGCQICIYRSKWDQTPRHLVLSLLLKLRGEALPLPASKKKKTAKSQTAKCFSKSRFLKDLNKNVNSLSKQFSISVCRFGVNYVLISKYASRLHQYIEHNIE